MKFYNRTNEIDELRRIQNLSFTDYSELVVTGRRRIGKLVLLYEPLRCQNHLSVCGTKNEATLCAEFIPAISQELGVLYLPRFAPFIHFSLPDGWRQAHIQPYNR